MAAARPSPSIPLLNLSEPTENDSHRNEDNSARERRVFSDPSKWKWRKSFSVFAIYLAFVFINAAYSTIAPFFPNKVGLHATRSIYVLAEYSSPKLCELTMICRLLKKAQHL